MAASPSGTLAVRVLALLIFCGLPVGAGPAGGGPVRIALVGDSTVATYEKPPADQPDLTGWGQVLGDFFDTHVEIRNFALSGRSSKSFLKEGHWKAVLEFQPDFVFIQFGHNDQKDDERGTDADKDFQANLRQFVDEARAAGAVPVLVTPVARRTYENGKASTTLTPYAQAIKKVSRDKEAPVIDLHAASLELFGRLGDQASADLTASLEDRTHFSRKGARAIARLVASGIPRAAPQLIPRLNEAALVADGFEPHDSPGLVRLALPPVIDVVVGLEANLYFDNVTLLLNAARYTFDVHCPKGKQQAERWTIVPKADDVGEHAFQLDVRNEQNELVARGGSILRVIRAGRGEGRHLSLLLIGDSLTHASVYPQRLLTLCQKPENPKLSLVGSHGPDSTPGEVRHEGYGGWTAQRFATHSTGTPRKGNYAQRASPFLYPDKEGKSTLDFSKYCHDVNDGHFPDFVAIFLGPNDIFSLDDSTIDAGIRTMLENYDRLVKMVHSAAPETRVGVMLPVPPASTQDAFGANYGTGQTRWQYKRNQHRLVERMLEHYGGRDVERIHLVPTYVNLDCAHNYPTESVNYNADSELRGLRQNNGVHPALSGYDQIGDTVFAWLKGSVE
jgi:lysophospholipase L1-like esterase